MDEAVVKPPGAVNTPNPQRRPQREESSFSASSGYTAAVRDAFAVALVATLLQLASAPADAAARKKRAADKKPLQVAVLPFAGKGSGGADASEALELELELVRGVRVVDAADVGAAIKNAGRDVWAKGRLKPILEASGVDVLIRGERGPGVRSLDALLVTVWGRDGKPRVFKELALGRPPEATAAAVVGALKAALADWRALKPIQLDETEEPAGGGGLRPEDVLLDEDVVDSKRRTKAGFKVGSEAGDKAGDKEADDAAGKTTARSRSFFDDPDAAAGGEASPAPLDAGPPLPPGARTLLLSISFDGGPSVYEFVGDGGIGNLKNLVPFSPGGGGRLEVLPLAALGVRWLALEGDLVLSRASFPINPGPYPVNGELVTLSPPEFVSLRVRGGGALKLRYAFPNDLAVGVRLGYRHYGASVEPQVITLAGQRRNVTLVPGFVLHALSTGLELHWPALLADRRLELDVRVDGLPATRYEEAPDNPGTDSVAVGWSAAVMARCEIAGGFFVEISGHSTGIVGSFLLNPGTEPDRYTIRGPELVQFKGGDVMNLVAGFTAGLGFMF